MILRNLPSFKGKNCLIKTICNRKIRRAKDVIIRGKHNCKYLIPNLKEIIGFSIFADGVYEQETIQLINKLLPPNGCFLDLGANIGAISVPVASLRPDVKIIAVEAAPWIFSYLKANIDINGLENVAVINKALADRDNIETDFYVPEVQFGKGSLAPTFTRNSVKVETIKIDTLIKQLDIDKVDLIKIDIEGFEYFAFNGAIELLSRKDSPDIIFEFVDWAEGNVEGIKIGASQELLFNKGYNLFKIEEDVLTQLKEVQVTGSFNILASKK